MSRGADGARVGVLGMLLQPWPGGRLLQGYQRGRDAPGGVQGGGGTWVPRGARGRCRTSDACDPGGWGGAGGWCVCGGTFGELQPWGLSVLESFGALIWLGNCRFPPGHLAGCPRAPETAQAGTRAPAPPPPPSCLIWGTTAPPFPPLQSDAGTASVLWVGGAASCCATSLSPSPRWRRVRLSPGRKHHPVCCLQSLGQRRGGGG